LTEREQFIATLEILQSLLQRKPVNWCPVLLRSTNSFMTDGRDPLLLQFFRMPYSTKTKSRWRVYSRMNGNKRFIFLKEFKSERAAENFITRPVSTPLRRRIVE